MRSFVTGILFLIAAASIALAQSDASIAQSEPNQPGAQAAQATPESDKDAQPKIHEELVVTATRYEQDSFATPLPITVISQEDLDRTRPERLVDALKNLAGIDFTGEGPFRGLPVIRGLASNRILILVDGERLNNARESTEFAGIQPGLVDLSEVERIEVLRGPASVLYGSDAIGGVINIITKQKPFTPGPLRLDGLLSYEYGTSADAQRARAQVDGAGEKMTFHLGVSFSDFNNYKSPEGEVPNSGMKQRSADGVLRFLVSDNSVLRVNLESTRTRDIGFPGYDPRTSGVDISFPKFDRDKLGLSWEIGPLAGLDSLSVRTYVQQVDKESKRNLHFGPSFFSDNFTTSKIDSVGLATQGSAHLADHHLTFGADFYTDELHDTTVAESTFGSSTDVAVPDSTQRVIGTFVQDELPVGERVNLTLGARGDWFTFKSKDDPRYTGAPFDVADSALSGDLGVRYAVTQHVELTASAGRAFRAPNLQERSFIGLVSTGDTWVIQNPSLGPETSLNFDAGFKVRYPGYTGGFTVYHNKVNGLISLAFLGEDPDTGLQLARFENIDKATLEGAEFELEAYFGPRWTAFGNVSYTRGTDDSTGDPLPLIPPLKTVLGVRFADRAWFSELNWRIVARQDRIPPDTTADDYEPTPGFAVVDIRGGFNVTSSLRLQLAVENLLDKAYHEPFNNRLESGRNFRASVSYLF